LEEQIKDKSEWYVRFIRIVDYTQKTDDIRYIKNKWNKIVQKDDIVMIRYWTPWVIGMWIEWVIANNMFKITPIIWVKNNI